LLPVVALLTFKNFPLLALGRNPLAQQWFLLNFGALVAVVWAEQLEHQQAEVVAAPIPKYCYPHHLWHLLNPLRLALAVPVV
jgi:hypothetical protein